MPHTSRADLSHAFCSYCGYPPMGRWRLCAHRVCMRCQMGVVLHAPPGAEPRYDDPFLIVDRNLAIQAVSRTAELVLSVDEPASLGASLEEFLICDNGDRGGGKLADVVDLVFAGIQPANTLELHSVANTGIHVQARVTACGPPPGALLILTRLEAHAAPSPNGRSAANRQLASVSLPDNAA